MKFPLSFFRLFNKKSKKRYFVLLLSLWIYTIFWILIIYAIWILDFSIIYKIFALIIEILFIPDINHLFISYDRYKKLR
jgi:hypothetical protein